MTPNDPKGEAGSRKTPLGLIPSPAMEETAKAMKYGADRYGAYNWRKTGVCATTYVHAILRHLNAWRDGEDNDPESGITHIAHIAASCNILMDAAACGKLEDDRVVRPKRMNIDAVVASPEWIAAAEITKQEFGLTRKKGSLVYERQDPTRRVVPIPDGMLPLPPAPEGKVWVGRGTFPDRGYHGMFKVPAYWEDNQWKRCLCFSGDFFHIELIDAP